MPRAVDDARGHCLQYSTRSPLPPRRGKATRPATHPAAKLLAADGIV